MMGVAYLLHLARRFSMPLVICLGLGTNQGSHVGKSPLGLYLDDINIYAGTAVITAAGNETGYGHHYRAVTRPEETLQTVELNVGEKDSGFSMEFWAQDVDIYRVGFISPQERWWIRSPPPQRKKTSSGSWWSRRRSQFFQHRQHGHRKPDGLHPL